MNDNDLAWAAGIFEGEGTIVTYWPNTMKYPALSLAVSMADEDVVQRFAAVVGTGKVDELRRRGEKKTMYRWKISRRSEVERVLTDLLPYLGQRRTGVALKALSTPSSGIRWGEGKRAGESSKYREGK